MAQQAEELKSLSYKEERTLSLQPLQRPPQQETADPTREDTEAASASAPVAEKKLRQQRRRRRCWQCCGCCTVSTVVVGIIILILALTVFKSHDPSITLERVSLEGLSTQLDTSSMRVHVNVTVRTWMRIRNPNRAAGFHYGICTTDLLYRGALVGQAVVPPGHVDAHSTSRVDAAVTVFVDVFLGQGSGVQAVADVVSGSLPMTARTLLDGRVRILRIIRKHVTVRSTCDMTIGLSASSQNVTLGQCSNKIKF